FAPKSILKLRTTEEAPAPETSSSIFGKLEDFWRRQTSSVVECFECKRKQQVSGAATSTICPSCSTHIDLRDYKITSGFSRSIRTRGNVHLSGKGDVHCFRRVHAEHIEIKGRMSGEIIAQSVTVHRKGSLEGDVTARAISVEKGGMFSGQLAIGQIGLAQGELLAKQKPTPSRST